MRPELWRRVREVFDRVVDLAPEPRETALDELCAGDDDLRREVESLVMQSDDAETKIPGVIEAAARDVVG